MPTQRTITVYKFNELSENAKKTAIKKNRNWHVSDFYWYEHTLEEWKQLLNSIGIENAEIEFSGFGSQGDGACIRSASFRHTKLAAFMSNMPEACGSWGDESESALQAVLVHKLGGISKIQGDSKLWEWISFFDVLDKFAFNLQTVQHHYSHENCHRLELEGYTGRDNVDNAIYDCADDLNELRRSICQAIYSDLREVYEYATSDSAVIEALVENECEFDVSGGSV